MTDLFADWQYRNGRVPASRIGRMVSPCQHAQFVRLLLDEQSSVDFRWKKGEVEARGHHRAEFRLPYCTETCDIFFNGISGIRAHYYKSIEKGEALTRDLIAQLADSLVSRSSNEIRAAGVSVECVMKSLHAASAKIWIDEESSDLNHSGVDAETLIAIEVPHWVKAAIQMSIAIANGQLPRPRVKDKALLGVQVPECRGIAILGAWLSDDSYTEFRVPSKRNRARHIRVYGFS